MSDALNHLVKARPEAMGHYFAFLKDCGTRLDPRTRNLISVITKVHARTERGLRQYLARALREGCTRDEVLDALLMAMPALGLAKIVWAVDVMLAMEQPQPAAGATARWHDLAAADGIAIGATQRIECDGRAVFAHHGAQGWRVFDSRCPHEGNDIALSALDGNTLACPRHGWRFDVRSGACTQGQRPLQALECRVEHGRLQAQW
ncbi:MAG TPA: Rieske 2Fe-2S domain-containing protein [Ramlibacter sp.]